MGSISKTTQRKRKNKRVKSGSTRKRELRRDQRIQAEKRLEEALGEKISLPPTR